MLDPDIKAKWAAALRSGDYKQGRGWLRAKVDGEDTWCCLGVLCNIIDDSKWIQQKPLASPGLVPFGYTSTQDPCTGYPPPELADKIGLTTETVQTLVSKNDGKPHPHQGGWVVPPASFQEIATIVEGL